ncbi:unnamed protein product, partial [Didymodactylos carnosus]
MEQFSHSKLRDIKSDIISTTVACAFPLDYLSDCIKHPYFLPPTQPVYAYLPLRGYGFRFVLQADFEVPCNRQEIMRDMNEWNDWLKSQMSDLLLLAYERFEQLPKILKDLKDIDAVQTIKYFLKFIPSKQECDPCFHGLIEKIMSVLIGKIKFPV